MSLDRTEQRQQAHAYLDRLPEDQLAAVRGLLESMLSPLDRKLALAPLDDEPVAPVEAAAIEAGLNSLERDGGVPLGGAVRLRSHYGRLPQDGRNAAAGRIRRECLSGSISPRKPAPISEPWTAKLSSGC